MYLFQMLVDAIEEWGVELLSRHHKVQNTHAPFCCTTLSLFISPWLLWVFVQLTINRVDASIETVVIGPHKWIAVHVPPHLLSK